MTAGNIVRIDPVPEFFSVTWMLGRRCNYDCMYCSPNWHDDVSPHHDLTQMQLTWQNIIDKSRTRNLPYKLTFTGGEVTTNKHFLPFLRWVRAQPGLSLKIFVTSNGSAGLRYYRELASLVDGLSLSTHGEYINEKVFFNKAKVLNQLLIRPEKSLHICIMDEIRNRDRIELYKVFCQQHNIAYSVNRVNFDHQTRPYFIVKFKHNINEI